MNKKIALSKRIAYRLGVHFGPNSWFLDDALRNYNVNVLKIPARSIRRWWMSGNHIYCSSKAVGLITRGDLFQVLLASLLYPIRKLVKKS